MVRGKYSYDYKKLSKNQKNRPLELISKGIKSIIAKKSKTQRFGFFKGINNRITDRAKKNRLNSNQTNNKLEQKSSVSIFLIILTYLGSQIENILYKNPLNAIRLFFIVLFVAVVMNFTNLQIFSNQIYNPEVAGSYYNTSFRIIPARRGQIYIRDLSADPASQRYYQPVTTTQTQATIFFNPQKLKANVEDGLDIKEVALFISGNFNLSYETILESLKESIKTEKPSKYKKLTKTVGDRHKNTVDSLYTNENTRAMAFALDIGVDEQEIRYYPQGNTLSATIGFVRRSKGSRTDALNSGCKSVVYENESRKTVDSYIPGDNNKAEYVIGNYGIEQEQCDLLSGLNGRRAVNNEINTEVGEDLKVKNGADIYLTIDKNIQKAAEDICAKYYKAKTNENGTPENCGAVVMNAKTGEILAMASYPTFDLNNYSQENSKYFQNVISSVDYDIGSIMKPLTIAAALNENKQGNLNSQGEVLGVDKDFRFTDFNSDGKPYSDNSGELFYIRNADGISYRYLGAVDLTTCLRLSINTCLSSIVDSLGNVVFQDYLMNRFRFGVDTSLTLPGYTNGLTANFTNSINSQYDFAQMGFGQGFTANMLQYLRAFSAIANGSGYMVEPTIYDHASYDNNEIIKTTEENSSIYQGPMHKVVDDDIAKLTRNLLLDAVKRSTYGRALGTTKINGYDIFAKSGTGQIGTKDCDFACHSRKGLVNQSCVGGVIDSKRDPIVTMVKLGKPLPGQVGNNFSSIHTCPAFTELMKFTLDYLDYQKNP